MKPIEIQPREVNGVVCWDVITDYDLSTLIDPPRLSWPTSDEAQQARLILHEKIIAKDNEGRGGVTDPPSGPVSPGRHISEV